jgi:hypothetical protein
MIRCNAPPTCSDKIAKRKGDISFETSLSQSDFSKFWFGQATMFVVPESLGHHELAPASPSFLSALHPIFSQFVPASGGSSQFIGWGCMDLSIAIVPPSR